MPVRIIAQIIVQGGQIVSRAFGKALRAEYETIQQARKATANRETQSSAAASTVHGISLQESKDILAIDKMDKEHIQERYDHMFKVNAKKSGGSFYLQSKVFRAKERLDEELATKAVVKPDEEKKAPGS